MVNTKSHQVTIELQKAKPIYQPGESIVGNIRVKINEKIKLTEVRCMINGEAHVHFTEKIIQGRGKMTRHFENREKYIKTAIVLYKIEENQPFLETGDYSYPFKFTLPSSDLPTSFMHELGKIYYSIVASLKIDWYKNYLKFDSILEFRK